MDSIQKLFTLKNAVILIGAVFLFWGTSRMLRGIRSTGRLGCASSS